MTTNVSLERRRYCIDRLAAGIAAGDRMARIVTRLYDAGFTASEVAAAEDYILTLGARTIIERDF